MIGGYQCSFIHLGLAQYPSQLNPYFSFQLRQLSRLHSPLGWPPLFGIVESLLPLLIFPNPSLPSIGNLLGEGKAQRAGIASNTAILMALVLSATSRLASFSPIWYTFSYCFYLSTMFLVFRSSWGYLFNNDPGQSWLWLALRRCCWREHVEVVNLVASIIPLVALFQVFDGNAAITAGILRARGKQVCQQGFYILPSNSFAFS